MTALAFEKPMIVSDLQGLRELVRDKTFALPPGDVDSLADALTRALGDPATLRRLGADSKQIAKQYDWDSIARTTVRVYGELAAGRHDNSAPASETPRAA